MVQQYWCTSYIACHFIYDLQFFEFPTFQLLTLKNGIKTIEIADGCGPVDATLKAIDKIVKEPVRLEEYLVQAITGGSEDTGKVHIQISKDGVFYYGFGNDTDVIYATAKAYVDALNKL